VTLTPQIASLIDKQDAFEIVGDQIAAILLVESANQQALATAGGKDPKLWKLRIFKDRANPWEEWSELDPSNPNKRRDQSPIVHVGWDSDSFDKARGNTIEYQQADGLFNLDCYGYGVSRSDGGTGHIPGDEDAGNEVSRVVRLVRNILMAGPYVYLGLQGLVGRRWIESRSFFLPSIDGMAIENIQATRVVLAVTYTEKAPEYTPQLLDAVSATVRRAATGEVLFISEFDETTP
jgi:hypothetical protein